VADARDGLEKLESEFRRAALRQATLLLESTPMYRYPSGTLTEVVSAVERLWSMSGLASSWGMGVPAPAPSAPPTVQASPGACAGATEGEDA